MGSANDGSRVRRFGSSTDAPVLWLHPWWGVTAAMVEWAEVLADAGRSVVLLDLYDGKVVDDIEDAEVAAQILLGDAGALSLLEQTANEIAAEGSPWAVVGFSLGAFLACRLAGRGPTAPDELVLFYGGQPPPKAASTKPRVALHVVPDDDYFTDEEFHETRDGFLVTGADLRVHRYEGCGHWFAERAAPGFDQAAFGLARSRVLEQLAR